MSNDFDPFLCSVFPIIFYDENDTVNIAGTSILVEHKSNYFLLTAAHVLRDPGSKYQLYLLLQDNALHLHEPAFMSKLQNNEDRPDIDIAYFPLDSHPTLMGHLNGCMAISLKEYDENLKYVREHYFIFGYPWRKIKFNRIDNELKAKPLQYFTNAIVDDSLYTKFNRSRESHMLVQYKPRSSKNSEGQKMTAPYPHGISGGPLFRALVDKNDEVVLLIFEGLLIEWKDAQVIVVTKKCKIRDFLDGKPT